MLQAPVTFPYVDWRPIKNLDSVVKRYMASCMILSDEEYLALGLKEGHLPELQLAKAKATQYISDRLRNGNLKISLTDVAEICHTSKVIISYFGSRPVGVSPQVLKPLCYKVLYESCHRVMFGEEGQVILFGPVEKAMKMYSDLTSEEKQRILKEAQSLKDDYEATHPIIDGTSSRRLSLDVAKERFRDIADARCGGSPYSIFPEDTPSFLSRYLWLMFSDTSKSDPNIMFYMFMAKETGLALDYFLFDDYAAHVPCFYKKPSGKLAKVRESGMLRFLRCITSVDQATREKMIATVIACAIKKQSGEEQRTQANSTI